MVDGYSRDNKEIVVEETVEEFFLKLLKLGMIELPPTDSKATHEGTISVCQVNGFFQEYIVSRSTEQNDHIFALDGSCSVNSRSPGRHLVIRDSWHRDQVTFESIDLSSLRSLTVYGEWESFFISEKMRALQVLDLEDASGVTDRDLEKIVKLLRRLKFLSLRGCEEICCLPALIGHLTQLETLDIRYTSIRKLPKSIVKLRNLQYIRAGERQRYFGVEVPNKGIDCMVALQTFGVIDAWSGDILEGLKNHTQLHKLAASNIREENYMNLLSAIRHHGHLESLSVWFYKHNEFDFMLSMIIPPVTAKLNLEMTTLLQEQIDSLAGLRNLIILSLHIRDFQDGKLTFETASFKRLLCLGIYCNISLETVKFGNCLMPNLEVLKLCCCRRDPELQFYGLNHLPRLVEFYITGNDQRIRRQLEKTFDERPKKIKPVYREEPPSAKARMPVF